MNVEMRVHVLQTFVTHPLVHMHQKKKIALEIASKFASPRTKCSASCEELRARTGNPP